LSICAVTHMRRAGPRSMPTSSFSSGGIAAFASPAPI
jgi:hypothetical protein